MRSSKTKKIKLVPVRRLIREADRVFSLWVRKREKACVTCGSNDNLTCSHLIRRGKHAVRYSDINCHTQCASCNFTHNQFPEYYTTWFLAKYSWTIYRKLVEESKKLIRWQRSDLETIIAKYK